MSTENYDPYYPDQPVVDQYLPVWARQPAFGPKPAFVWADDDDRRAGTPSYAALTYSELNAAVQRMARGLLETVRRGDTVLLLASPGLRLVKFIFACQRAGLVAVPIVPPDPSKIGTATQGAAHRHLLRAVSQTRPAAAVADAGYIGAVMNSPVAALKRLRWVSVGDLECHRGSGDDAAAGDEPGRTTGYGGCAPGETYLIQYTSGATGAPKPVVVTAGAAAHNVRAARKAYELHPGSVIASWLPQYHDCGLMFLLLTVVAGATCVLASPAAFVRRPRLWLELISEFRATCTPVPSFALPLVLKRGRPEHGTRPLDLGSLRNLILVNEPIYKSPVDEFVEVFGRAGLDAASISPSFGLAENCTFVSTAWRGTEARLWTGQLSLPSYKKLLPSARLPSLASSGEEPEIDIVLVDGHTGDPVADGVEGEIWVSSPSNASGYLGNPSASRQVFCARLPGGRAGGAIFVRTGDCGVVRGTERYLYVLGRSSDAIATDGQRRRVHAHYVETAAFDSSADSLRGGCIAAFATSPSSVAVVAELQKGRGNSAHPGSICDGIRRAVWEEEGVKVGHVVLAESGGVPKTTSGKLRRGLAREMLAGRLIPKVFEVLYDQDATCVRGGGDDMEVCGTSWVVGEAGGEVAGMVVMASGSASHRLRLQSSL
ncbi:hypothetical protein SEVIR_5G246300v4 [Setaria viridis]|uniref:AMP-dependent synthetase/ligase domain-containing protein n=2 Tax=Setaria viridis TaxID=4556 RepID=A0A4U6UNJ8_SETVI|nr:putative fatty-acid--CoA ligase fadD25 [Setaria viridis]TKW15569.1 hypothetical protein SEVIR_5G246300v2 [Setaria viridis]